MYLLQSINSQGGGGGGGWGESQLPPSVQIHTHQKVTATFNSLPVVAVIELELGCRQTTTWGAGYNVANK